MEQNQDLRLEKINQIVKRTELSKSTIYLLISKNKFPRPIKLTEKTTAWLVSDINQWLLERIAASKIGGVK